jgi:cytoskeletal protein RodZ
MTQTFGATLREARERKGISLRQIATATKISVAALESLERNDFSKLPGGIFSRAFVRSYAIEVGLDPDDTVHQFLQQFEGEHQETQPHASNSGLIPQQASPHRAPASKAVPSDLTPEFDFESKQRMASVVLKLVAVSVPIAAVILYFSSRGSAPEMQESSGEPQRSIAQQSAEPAPNAAGPAPARGATPPARAPQYATGAASAAQQSPSRVSDVRTARAQPPASAAAVAENMTIELAPSGDCWARLTADGTVVMSRLLKAGEREIHAFQQAAVLQVGDAAACSILINGRPARPLGPATKVREVRITRENYTTFLP